MDDITLLLVLEARDKAASVLDGITKRVKGYEDATKQAAAAAAQAAEKVEAATEAQAKAIAEQADAQAKLQEAIARTAAATDAARNLTEADIKAQERAAVAADSYGRAVEAQANAQAKLSAATAELASARSRQAAADEGDTAAAAAVAAAAQAQESALVQLQSAEKLVATRATDMAAAQKAAAEPAAAAAAAAEAEAAAYARLAETEEAVALRTKELTEAQEAAAVSGTRTGNSMKTVGLVAGATAVAVGYIGAKSVEAAADFQSSTQKIVSSGGEIQDDLDKVRQGLLNLAGQVGYSTDQLSAGFYKASSAGFNYAHGGLDVVRAAAEGAKAEQADLAVVADAVSSAMKDYHAPASAAATVTSELVAATSQGKTTFEELAASLHSVLPNASQAHIALSDILGDLASMTVHGMSAQQAAQNLNDVINHMQKPTSQQAKELALLGMTTNQLADDLKTKGLSGTLQEIQQRIQNFIGPGSSKVVMDLGNALTGLPPKVQELAGKLIDGTISMKEYGKAAGALDPISAKQAMSFATLAGSTHRIGDAQMSGAQVMQNYSQALALATGDATGLNVALMLTGENADGTNQAIKAVAGATTEAGNHVKGWSEIQGTFNQKMSDLKGSLEAAKISIGTGLLPAVTAVAGQVAKVVAPIAEWMAKHSTLTAIILGSIGALALLTVAIWAINAAMGALAANPVVTAIVAIVLVLAALTAGVIYAWNHWGWFKTAVLDTWNAIKVAAVAVWNGFLKPVFDGIRIAIMQGVVPAALWLWHNALEPAFKGIAAVATWLWGNVLKPIWDALVVVFRNVVGPVVTWLWRNIVEPAFKGMQLEISVAWAVIKAIFTAIEVVVRDVLAPIFVWLWHNVLEPVWQGIQIAVSIAWAIIQVIWGIMQIEIKILAAVFTWLWHNVLEPAWQGIAAVITWAWNNVIKPLWEGMKIEIHLLGDVFSWLWHNLIEPVWNGIKSTIESVWNNGIKPVFNLFKSIVKDDVAPAFKAGVDAIAAAWNGVLEVAKAPVRFVVNTVLNDGLLAAYNWIASKFGVKPDDVHVKLPAGFAAGGKIPGAPSNADNMLAMVATGEHIMPTARTAKWLPVLESIRLHDRLPLYPGDLSGWGIKGYAGGGVVGALEGAAGKLWDLFTDPVKIIKGPINSVINSIPGAGIIRDMVAGGAHRLLDGLISWVKGTSGASGVGHAMAFLNSQVGKPYGLGSNGPDAWDCSAIVGAVWAALKGLNPFQRYFSTMSEAPFFPKPGLGGLLTAGWTNPGEPGPGGNGVGHTAGVLAGVPFESAGGVGVRVGAGVTPVTSFAHVGHFDSGGPLYPGWTAAYNGTGRTEWVNPHGPGPGVYIDLRGTQVMSDRDIDMLIDKLDKRLARVLVPGAGLQVRR